MLREKSFFNRGVLHLLAWFHYFLYQALEDGPMYIVARNLNNTNMSTFVSLL